VCILWSDMDQPNFTPSSPGLCSPKRHGENVSKLISVSGIDVVGLYAPIFQTALYEVVLDSDMLAPFMKTGFLVEARTDLLSTLSSSAPASLPSSSPNSQDNHKAWVGAATYSASQLDTTTTCCLTNCQLIKQFLSKTNMPLVFLLVSMLLARSLPL
jgi:hypothetical protein